MTNTTTSQTADRTQLPAAIINLLDNQPSVLESAYTTEQLLMMGEPTVEDNPIAYAVYQHLREQQHNHNDTPCVVCGREAIVDQPISEDGEIRHFASHCELCAEPITAKLDYSRLDISGYETKVGDIKPGFEQQLNIDMLK